MGTGGRGPTRSWPPGALGHLGFESLVERFSPKEDV
jgi:hypothetical protein